MGKSKNGSLLPLQTAISHSFKWATTNFRWDNKFVAPVKLVTTKTRRFSFLLSFLVQLLHLIYLVFTVIRMAKSKSKLVADSKVFVEFLAVGYAMPLLGMQFFLIWRSQALVDFLNMLIVTHTNMNDGKGLEVGGKCATFNRALLRACNPAWTLFMVLFFAYPENPGHISSILPNPGLFTVLVTSIPTAYIVRAWWSNFHTLSITVSTSLFATISAIGRIRIKLETQLDKGSLVALQYRTLQILQRSFNDVYAWPLGITKALSILTILRTVHGAITKQGIFQIHQIACSVQHLVNVIVMFKAMSQVNEASREVLAAYKSGRNSGSWSRRLQRSCKELRVEIGGLYYADRGMNLTMYTFIVEKSVNILIANR